MKTFVTVIGIVLGTVLVVSQDAGAADTATPAGTATAGDIWSGCFAACQANYDEICEPAVIAAGNGKIPEEQVAPMCDCGVRVCANVCVADSGDPSAARPLPQVCHDLGVH